MKERPKRPGPVRRRGTVKNFLFSEGTYHFVVQDHSKGPEYYPFIQLNDQGEWLDGFCTCRHQADEGHCSHLILALDRIFLHSSVPLHLRFRDSLWNQLFFLVGKRVGFTRDTIHPLASKGSQVVSHTGKPLLTLWPLNTCHRWRFDDILAAPAPTEETSLKFSNLPIDELRLWREGRPSAHLRYELSVWSDLAKWFFLMQETEKYQIEYRHQEWGLPQEIAVKFPAMEGIFYVSDGSWPLLIDGIKTVKSPLRVYLSQSVPIQSMTYDAQHAALYIDFEKVQLSDSGPIRVTEIGKWLFFASIGFFPLRDDPLLRLQCIPKEQVGAFLEQHGDLARRYLRNAVVHSVRTMPQYALEFVPQQGLKIALYLFEPGDLQQKEAEYFGGWAYLPCSGFHPLDRTWFSGSEHLIPLGTLGEFVSTNKIWLSAYEGFETHLATVESSLQFHIDKTDTLHFALQIEEAHESDGLVDLGEWVFVPGRGFYPKGMVRNNSTLRPGLSIRAADISHFIDAHREELESLHGFFASDSPIIASGLQVALNQEMRIVIKPEYQMSPRYLHEEVLIFDRYTFVEGEGFCEIPKACLLPAEYRKSKQISTAAEPYFLAHELDALRPFIVELDPRLTPATELYLKVETIALDAEQVAAWNIRLVYENDQGSVDAVELWRAIHHGKGYAFSSAGYISLQHPRFYWLKFLKHTQWLDGGARIRLSALEWIRLLASEDVRGVNRKPFCFDEWQLTYQPMNLAGFMSTLRTYQQTGVEWLWFLYQQGLSGLLCDEMGLGKTHQAIALIVAVQNMRHLAKKKCLFLIVCPTSVMFHWQERLHRVCPALNTLMYYGTHRHMARLNDDIDVVLTSYGVLRSERRGFAEHAFEVAILDEVQVAKNRESQTHRALRSIHAQMFVGLTGTPVENHLDDLFSLFDLILPGYVPMTLRKYTGELHRAFLSRLLQPFIMRRKKSEVLTELPEKIEEIAYCLLSEEQKKLYRQAVEQHHDAILRGLEDDTARLPLAHIFSLFHRLKQICDHPALVMEGETEYLRHHSGKWELFVELLTEARESGQKVVVFSQFLKMLDIFGTYLKHKEIGFAEIRGATRDRQAQVQRFCDDPHCEVFIASLQAAGVGIDLIAASVVIHYDRWWNPAKENQATDRVHRIGQHRGVQVFKLVTKQSIEEHIHQLIDKKLSLLQEAVGFDHQDQIKRLDRKELLQIFRACVADANLSN